MGKARLPIGKMLLKAQGRILNSSMQMDAWNVEAKGTLTTEKGSIRWRSFVSTNSDVIITELTETGSEKVQWEFIPEVSQSLRQGYHSYETGPNWYTLSLRSDYPPNPEPKKEVVQRINTRQQALEVGDGYTTAWKFPEPAESRSRKYRYSFRYRSLCWQQYQI